MVRLNEVREGEHVVALPGAFDAGIYFIGSISTPWTDRQTCPRRGRLDGPVCRIEIFEPWSAGLAGLTEFDQLEVLYWLHESRRDLVRQSRRNDGTVRSTFSLRTPVRPNPVGTQIVKLVGVEGAVVFVRGLDCLDGTPLLDIKPDRHTFYRPPLPLVPNSTLRSVR